MHRRAREQHQPARAEGRAHESGRGRGPHPRLERRQALAHRLVVSGGANLRTSCPARRRAPLRGRLVVVRKRGGEVARVRAGGGRELGGGDLRRCELVGRAACRCCRQLLHRSDTPGARDTVDERLARIAPPRRVVQLEVEVRLLHLAVARAVRGRARDGSAVARVAMPLEVKQRKSADVAHAVDMDGEGAHKLEQLLRAGGEGEAEDDRRGEAAKDLLEQQPDAVLVEADKLVVDGARVPLAPPPRRPVVRVARDGLQQGLGVKGRVGRVGESARDGEDGGGDGEPPQQVESLARRRSLAKECVGRDAVEDEDGLVDEREPDQHCGERADDEGDEPGDQREQRRGELAHVGARVCRRGEDPRLEKVRQLVELAHAPARVQGVVAREGGGGGAAVELLGVLEEEEEQHECGDEGREQQRQRAAREEPPLQPSHVLREGRPDPEA
mmetsp:Transcript_20079/g.62923  ORF Transcript_20079/g.62923 Transcript_20079/m.62923 type:complete len:444 (-) Transcript_20079:771-2102(-)